MQRLPRRRFRLRCGDALRWDQREAAHVAARQPVAAGVPEEAGRAGGVFAQAGRRTGVEIVSKFSMMNCESSIVNCEL